MLAEIAQWIIGITIVVAAATMLALIFLISSRRRQSNPWINYLYLGVMLALTWQVVSKLWLYHYKLSLGDWIFSGLYALLLITCAILLIPIQRRVYRSKDFDELARANRELAYRQRLFTTFMDRLTGPAYIADRKGSIIYSNGKLTEHLGTAAQQLLEDRFSKVVAADVLRQHENSDNTHNPCESDDKKEFIELLEVNGKKTYWLSVHFPVAIDQDNWLVGCVMLEISEQLDAEATKNLLARIVEASPDAIYCFNSSRKIISWNPASERLYGYKPEEIVGHETPEILRPAYLRKQERSEIRSALDASKPIVGRDTERITKDGTIKPVLISCLKVYRANESIYVVLARDNTAEKRAEKQLLELNQQLNAKLIELSKTNQELAITRDEALEASNLKSAFVSNVSHELRTPLSGVIGLTELSLSRPLDPAVADMLTVVYQSATALLEIIDDILDVSKLESGLVTFKYQSFDPASVVKDCIKLVLPEITRKGLSHNVTIDERTPKAVFGDSGRIRQVLLNLLWNAVKFTKQGSVSIEVSVAEETAEAVHLQFSVADTGIGISPEERNLLFTAFSRTEQVRESFAGTGLGLAICQSFVELMGGTIDFVSDPQKGSRFWFTLPTLKTSKPDKQGTDVEQIAPTPIREAESKAQCRVLSVEDNAILAHLIGRQLERLGCEIVGVRTGEEAVTKVRTEDFDVVLMDINLPGISGYEATQRIREYESSNGNLRHQVVAMTAGTMPGDREKALEAGLDDYLAKPVSLVQLKEAIARALERSKQRKPIQLPTAPPPSLWGDIAEVET